VAKTVRVNLKNEAVRHWLSALRQELDEEAEALEAETRRVGAPLTAAFYHVTRHRTISGEVAEAIGNTIRLLSVLPDDLTLGTTAELADEELPDADEAEGDAEGASDE